MTNYSEQLKKINEQAERLRKENPIEQKRIEVEFDAGNYVHRFFMDGLKIPYSYRGKEFNAPAN